MQDPWTRRDGDPDQVDRARFDNWNLQSATTCLKPNICKCDKCKKK